MDIAKVLSKLTPHERAEVERLLQAPTLPNLLRDAFPLQRQFIEDTNKLKALFCTRRSAKSYTAGLYLLHTALTRPNTSSVYVGLTRDQSKRIIWTDILKVILKGVNIDAKLNETELTVTLPNGSIIYVLGVDDSPAEADKLLGKKFALAVIDEAASYHIDLRNLVYKILKPAMSDLSGTIVLCGTPDNNKTGLFYDLTRDIPVQPPSRETRNGWNIWTWTAYDNPHMAKQWQETINDLNAADEHVSQQAWYRQHYLGQWVIEEDAKIYRYNMDRNGWDGILPEYGNTYAWVYTLGIDLGFEDSTALTLLAYHQYDKNVYILRSKKAKHLTLTDTAQWIRAWMEEYPISYFIVDGAAKQSVAELQKHHSLPLEAAEKADKVNFIRIMNSDYTAGRIKINADECADLIHEYEHLLWDKRWLERGTYKEDPRFHGDCTDSALYGYRHCYHYTSVPKSADEVYKENMLNTYDRDTLDTFERFAREKMDRERDEFGSEYLYD